MNLPLQFSFNDGTVCTAETDNPMFLSASELTKTLALKNSLFGFSRASNEELPRTDLSPFPPHEKLAKRQFMELAFPTSSPFFPEAETAMSQSFLGLSPETKTHVNQEKTSLCFSTLLSLAWFVKNTTSLS